MFMQQEVNIRLTQFKARQEDQKFGNVTPNQAEAEASFTNKVTADVNFQFWLTPKLHLLN